MFQAIHSTRAAISQAVLGTHKKNSGKYGGTTLKPT